MENALLFSNLCLKESGMTEEKDAEAVPLMTNASSAEDPAIGNMSATLLEEVQVEVTEDLQEEVATVTILEIETTADLADSTMATAIEADALTIVDQDPTIDTTTDAHQRTTAVAMPVEDPGQDPRTDPSDTKTPETTSGKDKGGITTTRGDRILQQTAREDLMPERKETTRAPLDTSADRTDP